MEVDKCDKARLSALGGAGMFASANIREQGAAGVRGGTPYIAYATRITYRKK